MKAFLTSLDPTYKATQIVILPRPPLLNRFRCFHESQSSVCRIKPKNIFNLPNRAPSSTDRVRALAFSKNYSFFLRLRVSATVKITPFITVNAAQIAIVTISIAFFASCISKRIALKSFSAAVSLLFSASIAA